MLCRSCRDHVEAFQNHGCRVALLSNIQCWPYIVTLASSPRRGACPRPLLPSKNAMVERMESAHRHTGKRCTRSLLTSLPLWLEATLELSRSSSISSACSCSLSAENHSITTKLKLPHHEQTWLGSHPLHWPHLSPMLSAVATSINWCGQQLGLLAQALENMIQRHLAAPMLSTRPD